MMLLFEELLPLQLPTFQFQPTKSFEKQGIQDYQIGEEGQTSMCNFKVGGGESARRTH